MRGWIWKEGINWYLLTDQNLKKPFFLTIWKVQMMLPLLQGKWVLCCWLYLALRGMNWASDNTIYFQSSVSRRARILCGVTHICWLKHGDEWGIPALIHFASAFCFTSVVKWASSISPVILPKTKNLLRCQNLKLSMSSEPQHWGCYLAIFRLYFYYSNTTNIKNTTKGLCSASPQDSSPKTVSRDPLVGVEKQ